jgi:hypothetical protein
MPAAASAIALTNPAGPAPTTATSAVKGEFIPIPLPELRIRTPIENA